MRDDSVAAWCAALAIAHHNDVRLQWSGAEALFSRQVQPVDLYITLQSSRSPLLVPQGRRDLFLGACRAAEWLKATPDEARGAEWRWLIGDQATPIQITARKAPNPADGWDTYSLGRLHPAGLTGIPVTAWLPYLACLGAMLLDGGRQKWKRLQSRHPDVSNTFWCLRPTRWVAVGEIVSWYTLASEAMAYELRPVAGEMMSYCAI